MAVHPVDIEGSPSLHPPASAPSVRRCFRAHPRTPAPPVHLTFIFGQPGVHHVSLASPSTGPASHRGTNEPSRRGGRSMRNARKLAGIVAGVLAFSLIAAACGGSDERRRRRDQRFDWSAPAEEISPARSPCRDRRPVFPISNLVAELFSGQNPDVQVSVDGPGTGDGFVLFCKGETDISDASRPIEDDEKTACADGAVDYVELAIAYDGITVMTNPQNSAVTCLNSGDLYALFGPESVGIDTWNGADSLAKRGRRERSASPTLRSRSPRRVRSRARTTRSSNSPGSPTSRPSRACPRTRLPRCVPTTSRRPTTT